MYQIFNQTTKDKSVTNIKSDQEKKSVISNNKITCIDIYADWCQPCKYIEKEYESLVNLFPTVKFVKENIDLEISKNIKSIPFFEIYHYGILTETVTGANLEELKTKLNKIIKESELDDKQGPLISGSKNAIRNTQQRTSAYEFKEFNPLKDFNPYHKN